MIYILCVDQNILKEADLKLVCSPLKQSIASLSSWLQPLPQSPEVACDVFPAAAVTSGQQLCRWSPRPQVATMVRDDAANQPVASLIVSFKENYWSEKRLITLLFCLTFDEVFSVYLFTYLFILILFLRSTESSKVIHKSRLSPAPARMERLDLFTSNDTIHVTLTSILI